MNRKTWTKELLAEVGLRFRLAGHYVEGRPYGSGHINDTFAVVYDQGGNRVRYILQRLNTRVFQDPEGLMNNVAMVCRHTASKVEATAPPDDVNRRALTLVSAEDGKPFWVDDAGDYWRVYFFVEKAATHDVITSPRQAREAAKAFGRFQAMLADFPADQLKETIPGFHHTPGRLDALRRAAEEDPRGRAVTVGPELDFAFSRESLAGVFLDLHARGEMPSRVTHNDTKLNNVMLDHETGEGICVIDLDTVMPGLSLYDFGDMVRTAVSPAAEDERDLSKVTVRTEMFKALAVGFLSTAGSFLNEVERRHLVTAGKLLTYENGLRFLTDYLNGDIYFRTSREGQNLDRCRNQFALIRSLEARENELVRLVEEIPAVDA